LWPAHSLELRFLIADRERVGRHDYFPQMGRTKDMRIIQRCVLVSALFVMGSGCCNWRALFLPPDCPGLSAQAAAQAGPSAAGPGPAWQPPAPALVNPGGAINEELSHLSQQMRDAEENKRVLATRVRQLENQIHDKDQALKLAAAEIQDATEQIASTRKELKRWKEEMEGLRGKLRSVERDNKTTLEAIIRTLEQFLDRDKDTNVGVELLPPPK
jgi:hypothetical protein